MIRSMMITVGMMALLLVVGCQKTTTPAAGKKAALKTTASKASKASAKTMAKAVAAKTASAQCNVQVKVSGMTCAMGCAPFVTKALKKIKGVVAAKVTFKTRSASIHANGSLCNQKDAQGVLNKAFANMHYKSKLVKIVQQNKDSGKKAAPRTPAKPAKSTGKASS